MDMEELKIRQLSNQHLLESADCLTVVKGLCGVQAQFVSNGFHAINIRSHNFHPGETEPFLKSWTIRGTMHIFPRDDLPLMLHDGRRHFLRPCDTLEADE